ncbi:MAG: hypothetical protein KDI65_03790 [Alphaproteobacteria bacterium]|nr:hypothetical protein [Alphaproteobacteria bacterium]
MSEKKNRASCPPLSVRLSQEEREQLEQAAGDIPLGAFIRSFLPFDPTQRKRKLKSPIKDHKIIAQILAMLGQSRISSNLNQIAKALSSDSLLVTPDTEEIIQEACKAIIQMRDMLMRALNIKAQENKNDDAGR